MYVLGTGPLKYIASSCSFYRYTCRMQIFKTFLLDARLQVLFLVCQLVHAIHVLDALCSLTLFGFGHLYDLCG